jgi:hypothetical protein
MSEGISSSVSEDIHQSLLNDQSDEGYKWCGSSESNISTSPAQTGIE